MGLILIEDLRFTVLKFNLLLLEQNTHISSWLTSTLRGGFGTVFKKIVCINRNSTCEECILRNRCAYCYLFESLLPENTSILKKISNVPKPFILEEPEQPRAKEITFKLLLIGKAIDYLPYFIFTFDRLGKIGLGKKKNKYLLESVTSEGKNQIYNGRTMILSKTLSVLRAKEFIEKAEGKSLRRVILEFLTPTRIKSSGHLTTSLPFPLLVTNLLRRLSLLAYFHCGGENTEAESVRALIKEAQNVRVVKNNLKWYDLERYSTRQKTHLKMGGFKGMVQYEGNLKSFLPYLYLGEYLHVGKNTTFGLGKYRIVTDWNNEQTGSNKGREFQTTC